MGNTRQVRFVFGAVIFAATVCSAALPAGYTELPYVESTYNGKQWVYTDYVPEWNHRVVCRFRVNQVGSWDSPGVFCARGTASNDKGYAIAFGQGGSAHPNAPGAIQCYTGGWASPVYATDYLFIPLKTDYEVEINHFLKKWRVGDDYEKSTRDHSEFTAKSPLAIFCQHTLGSSLSPSSDMTVGNCLVGRVYYLRAYDSDGRLIHEFVPARDDNATVGTKYFGFYDTVAGRFWPNCSATPFATDPSVPANVRLVDRAAYASDAAAGSALVAAAAAALPTDHVKVTGGTKAKPHVYRISSPVLMTATSARLCSASDDVEAAVIDAGGTSAGVIVTGAKIVVTGVTVRKATGYENGSIWCGGGIAAIAAGTVISNCVVRNCFNGGTELALRGGGVYLNKSTLADSLVADCIISNDMASTGRAHFYGGGVYAASGSVVKNVEISGCLAFNNQFYASQTWNTGQVCGGGLALDQSAATDCYVHDNVITNGPKQTSACNVSHGAGVAALVNSTVTRSVITKNRSCCSHAGFYMTGANATLDDSTISSNVVFSAWNSAYPSAGVGIGASAGEVMRNCLIEGNDNQGTYWDAGGGAGSIGKGSSFLGGVVRGNVASGNCHCGGLFVNGGVVSNVVFDANYSTDSLKRRGSGAIEFRAGGSTIRDCWFVRNVGGDKNLTYAVVNFGSYTIGSVVRNCFFTENTGSCVIGGSIGADFADCTVESCTFVSNHVLRGAVWCDALDYSVPATVQKMVFTGCAFWKNGVSGDLPGIPVKFKNVSTKVTYCYDQIGTGLTPGNYHNLTAANGEPKYINPAKDDWRIRSMSVLRDRNLLQDWMGDGARNGPHDMGDGTWTEKPAGTITVRGQTFDVGVVVTRNRSHPRISPKGTSPDIGCAEYTSVNGLVFFAE